MDATLPPTKTKPPAPAALPSDVPLPAANVIGSLPHPHAATLPPTVVDILVNAPPVAVRVLPIAALLLPLLPAGTTATSVSAPSGRGGCGRRSRQPR